MNWYTFRGMYQKMQFYVVLITIAGDESCLRTGNYGHYESIESHAEVLIRTTARTTTTTT